MTFHPKDGLGMEFTACSGAMMPEGVLTSFTVCDAYLPVRHSY